MNNRIGLYFLLVTVLELLLGFGCKRDEPATIPVLTTAQVNNITVNSAICGGKITSEGKTAVIAYGVCWNTTGNPEVTDSITVDSIVTDQFVSTLRNLSANTTYHVRAYATNSIGTGYGPDIAFTTLLILFNHDLTYGSVSDIDGNSYKTIQIGTQIWMAENLRTSKYNDGTPIPNVTIDSVWSTSMNYTIDPETGSRIYQGTGAFCWYLNDSSAYEKTYGKLYDYFAVNTGNLCPTGWHVPSLDDWITLENPFNIPYGATVGADLMEAGSGHWNRSDIVGINETGFTAVPGGRRYSYGTFNGLTLRSEYWTSSETAYRGYAPFYPIPIYSSYQETPLTGLRQMGTGLSVRCLMD